MMTKELYKELLKSKAWKKKRQQILERDNHTCQKCKKSDKELHVHHKYYVNGKKPWEYPHKALVTLCKDCHKREHDEKDISEFTKKNCQQQNNQPKKNKQKKKKPTQKDPSAWRKERAMNRLKNNNNKYLHDLVERREKRRKESGIYNLPEYQHLRDAS